MDGETALCRKPLMGVGMKYARAASTRRAPARAPDIRGVDYRRVERVGPKCGGCIAGLQRLHGDRQRKPRSCSRRRVERHTIAWSLGRVGSTLFGGDLAYGRTAGCGAGAAVTTRTLGGANVESESLLDTAS